jgi:HK97 family phage prohead protease
MKSIFETKDTAAGIAPLDVDITAGVVKVVWNTMDYEDFDEEEIAENAFDKTIKERGPEGSNLICGLIDHHASIRNLYGKPKELMVDQGRLMAVIPVLKTELGKDLIIQYDGGVINQQSVGFAALRDQMVQKGNRMVRRILEAKLYEGSAVLWGANWLTETLDVARNKANGLDILKDKEAQMRQSLKLSGMTDDTYILNEIRMKQLQQAIETFKQAIEKSADNKILEGMIQKFLSSIHE